MLDIQVLMNTPLEQVFNFKCITAQDQNLEMRLRNDGGEIVCIQSLCDLVSDSETVRIEYLYPQGPQKIVPGDVVSFFCYMDENRFAAFREIIFYDTDGRKYSRPL